MLEIVEKVFKNSDRFAAISDLQRGVCFIQAGNAMGNSVESFQSKFKVPRDLNILVSRDKDNAAFLQRILENFELHGKLNSFEIP